jgi:type IV secretion system protein VirB10
MTDERAPDSLLPEGHVPGERDAPEAERFAPAASRVRHWLAIGFMSLLGLGSLTWYYAHAVMRQDRTRQPLPGVVSARAPGDGAAGYGAPDDVPLPGLGLIDPPASADRPEAPPAERPPPAPLLTEIPVEPTAPGPSDTAAKPKSAAEIALERKLSGEVFASHRGAAAPAVAVTGDILPASPGTELGALLRPAVAASVRAQRLPDERLLLAKGAFIDCTLETAIDSTLPGMTTCVMASDTFGVDGTVVLMERGTKLIGETRGQVQQGSARIFVLWTEARTPTGVVVPLDSPGADELGRSGLPGEVNRHFWQRFGAAMLVSVIDGAAQSAVQSSRGGGGTVVVNPSASQDVLTEILRNTVSIAPTVVKRNGDRIQVLVARDVDFRSVYELRSASAH